MPAYDFRCSDCGHECEGRFSILAIPASVPCPACRGTAKRVECSGGSAFNLKPVSSLYPYVSNRLPFGIEGCPHSGKLKKTVILNRQHEDRIFKERGFVKQD